jgi:ADP-ribose pyrophosphatase YjhB (NUDIX family)
MSIRELVDGILEQHQANGGKFENADWEQIARIVNIVPAFPNMPRPLFVPMHRKTAVSANIELVIIRDGKVLLVKRTHPGRDGKPETEYHTPGTYIAEGESLLETAQRCADGELKVVVTAVKKADGILHSTDPRFASYSIGVLAAIEGEPAAGEWFDKNPGLLEVQQTYWDLFIEPYLHSREFGV